MSQNNESTIGIICRILVHLASIASWVVLASLDWKIFLALFFILWSRNLSKLEGSKQ